ncbi:MAG TPA: family 2 glycosyl transferase, partial [Cytophagales bacterium]|nr:family 2 glycosyl transferase [Cytophagales bacterium]
MILPFFLLGLGVLTTIITLILWLRWKPSVISEVPEMIWPKVSVLVPARDEEQNLPRCLNALLASDYPLDRIEILVGDDHSTDNTRKVIQNYAAEHPQVSLVEVGHSSGNARAKANVLVYLTRAATHDIWLLTDADIAPSPGWLKAMVGVREREQAGLVAGVTMVESKSLWGQLQKVDWMMGWGMIQLGVEAGQPVTSAGNNMLVTREAYQAVGGYEKLPFSVTEDFVLYHAII